MNRQVLPSARTDIRRQYEYYLELDRPELGDRFFIAVNSAIDSALQRPEAGAPKQVRNPQLTGLRTWSVPGFNEFRVYYLVRDGSLIVVRVLHGRRDVDSILDAQIVDQSDGE